MAEKFDLYMSSGRNSGDEVLYSEGHDSESDAVRYAETAGLEYFTVYRQGAHSYTYCSW